MEALSKAILSSILGRSREEVTYLANLFFITTTRKKKRGTTQTYVHVSRLQKKSTLRKCPENMSLHDSQARGTGGLLRDHDISLP